MPSSKISKTGKARPAGIAWLHDHAKSLPNSSLRVSLPDCLAAITV
jgi:hypothetical protein